MNISAFIPKFISASGDIATKVGTASSAIQAFSAETGIAAASLGSFAIAAAAVLAAVAAVGIGIYEYERYLDRLDAAADEASAGVLQTQSDLDGYASKIIELNAKLADSNTSFSEAATIRGELHSIQSELIAAYGEEAKAIAAVGDSAQETNEKMGAFLGTEAKRAIDENLKAYERAEEKILNGNAKFLNVKGYSADILDFANDIIDAYDNVTLVANGSALKVTGSAYEVQNTLNEIYDKALNIDESTLTDKQKKVFEAFKLNIRSGLYEVESVIKEFGDRYQSYLLNQILADDTARGLMNRVSGYVDELNNAIAEGDYTAASSVIRSLLTLENLELHGEQIGEELRNYIAQIIDEAINGAPAEAKGEGIKGEDWWIRYYGNGLEQGAEQTARSIKQSFDSLFTDSEGKETDFSKAIDNYISNVTDLQDALSKLDSGTLSDSDKFKLFKDFPQLAAGSDDLKSAIESLLDSMDSDIASEFDKQLENLSEQDQAKLLSMKDAILGIGNASESSAARLSSFKDGLNLVQTAIGESASGFGLTTESVNALIARYEKLEGFDMADLFTKTANGIRLNKDAFEDLERAYTSSQQADIANDLADAQQRYADLTSQIDLCRNAQERIGLYSQRSAVLDEINDLELLQAEYDGLTSAYNRWVFAQNSANENDSYAAIAGALEGYKESIDDGWITAETRAFIDLISAQDLSAAKLEDVYTAWEGFHKNIEGSGGYSITDFFRWDDDKHLTTEGLENFVKALHNTLGDEFAKYEDGTWKIDLSGDKASMVESAMGISEEFQEILVSALGEAGDFEISLGTIFGNTDLASTYVERAGERINALRSQWGYEPIEMAFDSTDIETVESNLTAVQEHLATISSEEYRPYVNDSDIVDAEAAALMLSQQLAELENQEFLAGFDTTHITQDGQELLDTITNLMSTASELDLKIGMDIPTGDLQEKVSSELSNLQSFLEGMGITLDIPVNATNTQTLDAIISAMANMTDEQRSVFVEVTGLTDIQNVKAAEDTVEDKDISVTANTTQAESALNNLIQTLGKIQSKKITITTNYVSNGKAGIPTGGGGSVVNGTAHAGGTWGTRKTEDALMGELGREILVDPNSGTWHTVGDYGAEIVKVPKGSIIFNHQQTEDLLKHGWVAGRGHAYAGGTAYAATAFGSFLKRKATGSNDYTINKKSSSSSKKSSSSSSSSSTKKSSSKSSSAKNDLETLDWIEVALERIEQEIETLDQIADSAYKNLSNRLEATSAEIGLVTDEIEMQKAAYDRYMQQASSVGLSDDLAELVRTGAIDIVDYSKDTQELIKDYQEWYEKALDCSKAIDDLHESLADLYTDGFNAIKDDYEAQLDLLEHLTNTYDNHIEQLEAKGYMASIAYQRALQNVEAQNKQILEAELEDLIQTYSDAMNSGEIEEGSEAWYEMNQEINAVKEAIDDCNLSMLEIGNTIREIQWDRFDYLQDLISEITEEADFLIDLMSNSDLLNGSGGLTSEGMATLGLRAQNFNTYMSQADKYAAEILSLDKEIANDPYNTDLIERRQELLDLQRKSIQAAEDEKQAMADLVHDGIEEQLSALKDLIDAYNDSLDSAKDLHDYQKNIEKQTKNIASIQKQLAAYQGDTSEETRATVQKLRSSLAEAQEELEETQYEQYIKDQKALLDDLYNEAESMLNARLDDIDGLILDLIDTVNSNAGDISDTLAREAESVGYTMTAEMSEVWQNSTDNINGVVTSYGDLMASKLTSLNVVISGISAKLSRMIGESEDEAANTTSTTTATTTPIAPPVEEVAEVETVEEVPEAAPLLDDETKKGVAAAIWSGGYGWGSGTTRTARLAAVFGENNGIQALVNKGVGRNVKASAEYSYANMRKKFLGYKTGGLVDYTGLAWLDGKPGSPELVLSAKDTQNFIDLRDILADISSNSAIMNGFKSLPSIPDYRNGGYGNITTSFNGGININIAKVNDADDLMYQLQNNDKIQRMLESMTVNRVTGGSKLDKYKFKM